MGLTQTASGRVKAWRLAQVGFASWAIMVLVLAHVVPPWQYRKDILIDYVTARALRDGLPLFPVLREIQGRYFANIEPLYPFPNFHPPTVWLLNVPLSLLPFEVLSVSWLGMCIALLVLIAWRLGLSWRVGLLLAAWPPVFWHLYIGQYELLILGLALWAWRSAAIGKEWRAGLLLGAAGLLKFYPALLLLPYLYRRRWRVVAGGAAAGAVGLVASLLLIGFDGAVFYVQGLAGVERQLILRDWGNGAPYAVLSRLLGGSPSAVPLLDAPQLILPVTLALLLAGLAALLLLPAEMAPVGLLVLMPNSMWYCAVLLLPQIVMIIRYRPLRWWGVVVAAAISIAFPVVANWLPGREPNGPMPLWLFNVLCSLQAIGYVGLLALSVIVAVREQRAPTSLTTALTRSAWRDA